MKGTLIRRAPEVIMIEMRVAGIGLDPNSGQPIVVLGDTDCRRALPIWVGVAECNAIAFALSDERPERPMTHDLLLQFIEELGGEVVQVEVNEISDHMYMGTIRLRIRSVNSEAVTDKAIDARPSDAIALALRADVPIYVSEEVVLNATVAADVVRDELERKEFQKFLDNVKASDFKNELPGDQPSH
jgi:bifunctional DNase/RNase